MIRRRWFGGLSAVLLYVTGMNDQALGLLGGWWLHLASWLQAAAVILLLTVAAAAAARVLAARRAAYDAAVHAAGRMGTTR